MAQDHRGQAVGNDTRSHRDLTTETDAVVRKQLLQNERLHESILGRPMLRVFRPPYGAHDRRVRRLAGELGYRYTVLWTVDIVRLEALGHGQVRDQARDPGATRLDRS